MINKLVNSSWNDIVPIYIYECIEKYTLNESLHFALLNE